MREIVVCSRDGRDLHYRGLPRVFSTSLLGNPLPDSKPQYRESQVDPWDVAVLRSVNIETKNFPFTNKKRFSPENIPQPFFMAFQRSRALVCRRPLYNLAVEKLASY